MKWLEEVEAAHSGWVRAKLHLAQKAGLGERTQVQAVVHGEESQQIPPGHPPNNSLLHIVSLAYPTGLL